MKIATVADLIAELRTVNWAEPVCLSDGAQYFEIEVARHTHHTGNRVVLSKKFDPAAARARLLSQVAQASSDIIELVESLEKKQKRLRELVEYRETLEGVLRYATSKAEKANEGK